jgi:hypothetical protein
MRDPARIDRILKHLRDYWRLYPDQRLGQLVINGCPKDEDLVWHTQDDEWEKALEEKANKCPRCGERLQRCTLKPSEGGEAVACTACVWPNPDPSWSTQK